VKRDRPKAGTLISLRSITALLCAAAILGCIGCAAGLPDVSSLLKEIPSGETPAIAGSQGPLTEKHSEKLISGLERKAGETDLIEKNALLMERLSGHRMTTGNKTTLLVDGPAAFAAMLDAINGATTHVNIEIFKFENDEIGRRFIDALVEKQLEGVSVNIIYDSAGSLNTPASFFDPLKEAGGKVVEFNPINPAKSKAPQLITHRDHKKLVIVDGKKAFTGGINFSSVYSGSSAGFQKPGDKTTLGWRDTQIMIEGPAVAQFQSLFIDTWKKQKGPTLNDAQFFPPLTPEGNELVMVISGSPDDPDRTTYVMYVAAIMKAERSVHLTNPYFVPERQIKEALTQAAKRGVDVSIILPGLSDVNLTLYAAQSHYEDLLESGIKLYEHQNRVLHSKTAVIDGVWSTVGSTNLDLWSFIRNDEMNAIVLGTDFAGQMEALFANDIQNSKAILPDEWARRPLWNRVRELFARMVSHWL
jgi:cardiolipin synthase A/B